jgi:uncharacterized membrane protein YebE (DUF533 family)
MLCYLIVLLKKSKDNQITGGALGAWILGAADRYSEKDVTRQSALTATATATTSVSANRKGNDTNWQSTQS